MATERDAIQTAVDKFNLSLEVTEQRIKENLVIDGAYVKEQYGKIRGLLRRITPTPK